MPQRVSDERLAAMIAEAEASGCYIQDAAIDLPAMDLALDLRDARAEIVRLSGVTHFDASAEEAAKLRATLAAVTADANAAIQALQRELDTLRRERDERPVL